MPPLNRRTVKLTICLLLLYFSWGSGFLANKIALENISAFMLTGVRFSVAGLVVLLFTYIRREKSRIGWYDIKFQLGNAVFMVLIGSGFLVKGQELNIPSGLAAILYASCPIWFTLAEWLFWGGTKPGKRKCLGLGLGFSALMWLNISHGMSGDVSLLGIFLLFISTLAWVYGSFYSRDYKSPNNLSFLRSMGLMLLIGGLESFVVGFAIGERIDFASIPLKAYGAIAHLTFACSLIAYTTYVWLLLNSRPIVAISYEYVVPLIAVVLGVVFANEPLSASVIVVSFILIFSVFLITAPEKTSNA